MQTLAAYVLFLLTISAVGLGITLIAVISIVAYEMFSLGRNSIHQVTQYIGSFLNCDLTFVSNALRPAVDPTAFRKK